MERSNLIIILFVVIGTALILFGGVTLLSGDTQVGGNGDPSNLENQNSYFKGGEDADVVITAFSNFACGHCSTFAPVANELEDKYGDQVKIVFRHFPTTSAPSGVTASRAAEAAGVQDKFWEMHDILFAKQGDWVMLNGNPLQQKMIDYAAEAGVKDLDQFELDLTKNQEIEDKIAADMADAQSLQVPGTPALYLNDQTEPLPDRSFEFLSGLIEEQLAQ